MKIFITGGNGMVGQNIQARALTLGYEVIAPSRSDLDLQDFNAVQSYFKKISPDVVIHCAGLVGGIQANMASPFDFCYDNLHIGMNVIKASFDTGVKKLINLGSSCMYPRDAINPLKESDILKGELEPTNEGYAIAKLAIAKLAEYISSQHNVAYKTIIPCNLYGYWDKFDPEKSHMIPAVIRKIHEAKESNADSVDIWGDGLARREFLFAEDFADFIFFALNKFNLVPNYMNVGLGSDYSINEYYEAVREVVGFKGVFKHDLSKPVGMKQKLVDISLQTNMGWKPATNLTTGIERTYQFFLKRL